MFRTLLSVLVLTSVAAPAQLTTTYTSDRATPMTGDVGKIVCKKEEKIGTRLGARKLCLTVAEWQAREAADREQSERVQSGVRARCPNDTCLTQPGKEF